MRNGIKLFCIKYEMPKPAILLIFLFELSFVSRNRAPTRAFNPLSYPLPPHWLVWISSKSNPLTGDNMALAPISIDFELLREPCVKPLKISKDQLAWGGSQE